MPELSGAVAVNVLKLVKPVKDLFVTGKMKPRRVKRGPWKGLLFVCSLRDDLYRLLGFYEHEIREHVHGLVQRADVVADVGAADGWYTILFGRDAELVYTFEPDPGRVENMLLNAEVNGLDNVMAYGRCGSDEGIRLDALDPLPDLVKVDVEGDEAEVVRSMGSHIADTEWVIETHGHDCFHDVVGIFNDHGIKPFVRSSNEDERRWVIVDRERGCMDSWP